MDGLFASLSVARRLLESLLALETRWLDWEMVMAVAIEQRWPSLGIAAGSTVDDVAGRLHAALTVVCDAANAPGAATTSRTPGLLMDRGDS